MKKVVALVASLLMVMMAIVPSAGAQGSLSDADTFEEIGVKHGYIRVFADPEAVRSGTPSADGAPMMVMTGVISFKDTSQIKGHLDEFVDGFAEEFFVKGYETEKVRNLGSEAIMVTGEADLDGDAAPATGLFARHGDYVSFAVSMGTEDTAVAEDAVAFMVDAKPSTTRVAFNEDGTSTGGEFDMMPTQDDVKGMENLTPFADMDLMESNATPRA